MLIEDKRGQKISRIIESMDTKSMTIAESIERIREEVPDFNLLPFDEWLTAENIKEKESIPDSND